MTALTKPVTRELGYLVRDRGKTRPMMATMTASGIEFRAKGTRTSFLLPWGAAYVRSAQLAAAAKAAEKKQLRGRQSRRKETAPRGAAALRKPAAAGPG